MSDCQKGVLLWFLSQSTPKVKRNLRFRISSENIIFPGCKLLEDRDYFSWNFILPTASGKGLCREFELKNTWWMNEWMNEFMDEHMNLLTFDYESIPTCVGWIHKGINKYTSRCHMLAFVNERMDGVFVPSMSGVNIAIGQGFGKQRWHTRALLY